MTCDIGSRMGEGPHYGVISGLMATGCFSGQAYPAGKIVAITVHHPTPPADYKSAVPPRDWPPSEKEP